jgi:hypothetical protein
MQPQPQLRYAVPSWDGDRLSFEVDNGGRRFGCWMSRKALASAGTRLQGETVATSGGSRATVAAHRADCLGEDQGSLGAADRPSDDHLD